MTVLTIVLTVIAAVLLIIGLILIIPADVGIGTFTGERFRFTVRVLFLKFGTNSGKKKEKDEKSGADKLRKLLGLGKSDGKKKNASASASDTVEIALSLIRSVGKMILKCPVKKLYIKSVSAGDAAEAAFDYGVACSVIYPAVGLLESQFSVSEKGKDITVLCDYEKEDAVFEAEAVIRIRLFRLLGVLITVLKEYFKTKNN